MNDHVQLFLVTLKESVSIITSFMDTVVTVIVFLLAALLPFFIILAIGIGIFGGIAVVVDRAQKPRDKKEPENQPNLSSRYDSVQQSLVGESADKPQEAVTPYTHTNSKGVKYYLNKKNVVLRGGKHQLIYYFSKDLREEACALPDKFNVLENPRNGFLTVRLK